MNAGGTFNDGISTTAGSFIMNGGLVNIASGQTITLSNGITSNTNSAHQTSQILGGSLALVSGTTTFSVAQDSSLASDLTISSSISGGAVTKTGNGTLTLSGANTYTGTTTLSAGTIEANSGTALGTGTVAITRRDARLDKRQLDRERRRAAGQCHPLGHHHGRNAHPDGRKLHAEHERRDAVRAASPCPTTTPPGR